MKCCAVQINHIKPDRGNSSESSDCTATLSGLFIGDKMKRCSKCKKTKVLSEFFKSRRNKDGLYGCCKSCQIAYRQGEKGKAYQKNYHQSKQGKAISRKATNKYRKTEKGIKNATQSKKQWRINNPKHNKANRVVQNAVRYDLLPNINTLQCSCGHKAEHYHHWYGYEPEHWFDIIAVCYGCHLKYHNNNFNP